MGAAMNKNGMILACGAAFLVATIGLLPVNSRAETTVVVYAQAIIPTTVGFGGATLLDFGTFARPKNTGTVELSPVRGQAKWNLKSLGREKPRPASMYVAALPGQTFGIAVGGSTRIGGKEKLLEISNFTHNAGATPVASARGGVDFNIGATLYISENTPSGLYRGSFDVIISNN
jgi:hypothetical protein